VNDAAVAAGVPSSPSATTRGGAPTPPAVAPPVLPPDVPQLFAPLGGPAGGPVDGAAYVLHVAGIADVAYVRATLDVDTRRRVGRVVEPVDGPAPVEWVEGRSGPLDLNALSRDPQPGMGYRPLPEVPLTAASVAAWTKLFERHLRSEAALTLWRCRAPKLTGAVGESERDFRVRCRQAAREARDAEREKLRQRFEAKMDTLRGRLNRAERTAQREAQQAGQRKVDAAISVGTALLGSFLGRRGASATGVSTALRSINRVPKESADAQRARQAVEQAQAQLRDLETELKTALDALELKDADALELESVRVLPKSSDITTRYVGLLWIPFRRDGDGRWREASAVALTGGNDGTPEP
jgi:hypothetical protein